MLRLKVQTLYTQCLTESHQNTTPNTSNDLYYKPCMILQSFAFDWFGNMCEIFIYLETVFASTLQLPVLSVTMCVDVTDSFSVSALIQGEFLMSTSAPPPH